MDAPLGSTVDDEFGEAILGVSFAENSLSEYAETSIQASDALNINTEIDSEEMQLQLFSLACNEHMKFNQSRNTEDLNRTIALYCFALSKIPEDSELHPKALFNLSCTLEDRFREGGLLRDLDQAISVNQAARDLLSPTDGTQLLYLDNLAARLKIRFDQTKELEDLDEVIEARRDILELDTVPPASRHVFLRKLARAYESRFEEIREREDLDEAISLYRECIELVASSESQTDLTLSLRSLADALVELYGETGQESNLDEAVMLFRQTLDLDDPSVEGRSTSLHNLAYALKMRFDQSGQQQDLEESIKLHKQMLELLPAHHRSRSTSIINLANAIMAQYEQTGHESDLEEAIQMYQEGRTLEQEVSGPPSESEYMAVNNLAAALQYRFELTGQRDDLDESILLHRSNLELLPARHPRRPEYLTNLANSLNTLCRQTGHRGTMDEAILAYRQAFELFPPSHPVRSRFVNNLAQTLLLRFEQIGRQSDYEEAVALHRKALELHPGSHPVRVHSLNNLADTLMATTRTEDREIEERRVEEAIGLYREALELCDSYPSSRATVLNSLASTLLVRFKRTSTEDDLDEAVLRYREALALLPSSSPSQPLYVSNLGHAFHSRFKHMGAQDDLVEAVALKKKAIGLFPSPHRQRYVCFTDLGNLFTLAYIRMEDPAHLEEAMSSYKLALQNASHSVSSIHSIADTWSYHADRLNHSSALEAYNAALQSLSQMASLSLDIYSRQRVIQTARDGLATRAAWYAIRKGHFDKAIEFLEGGRAIFWSQALHLRTSFDRLRDTAPELAHRLQGIITELEHASYCSTLSTDPTLDNKSKMSLEIQEARFRQLDEEWSKGLSDARNIPGFEDFLQARRLITLQAAAAQCPVVFLVPSKESSDCLIMTTSTIRHIHFSGLSEETLRNLVNMTKLACSQRPAPRFEARNQGNNASLNESVDMYGDLIREEMARAKGAFGGRRSKPSSSNLFEYILKTLWLEVVKPVIKALNLQKSESPKVLKWCSTGVFSFLPIHAAGLYDPDHGLLECASDYMVSSYTPTIGLLLPSIKDELVPGPQQPFQMMVVVDVQLPSAIIELEKIKARVPKDNLVELGSRGASSANVEAVCSNLRTASIAHFACHGVQDHSNPLDSSLLVNDGKLSIAKIMQQSVPSGSLAFLCACETAMGDVSTPDEAMSVGACLLFSGYRSVVATMWEIADADGPNVADAFYEELFKGGDGKPASQPDMSKSALALHMATRKLRLSGVGYNRWVPFIHMGQ